MVNVDSHNALPVRPENAWTHLVRDLLCGPSAERKVFRSARARRSLGDYRPVQDGTSPNVTVTIEERLASRLIAVTWSDSTCCSYRGQLWRYAIAKQTGKCALSGESIKRGDAVFRPRTRARNIPLNRDAMILVASIDARCAASAERA
ncbi:DUF3331 domain-containing protein [Trinickia dabaoshanensis]|nr:DUF3331 domain-containing protein [Trinickia dabaoshanensis]